MLARLFAATSLTALLMTGAAYAQSSSSSGEVILPKKNQTQDAQQPKATDGQQQDMTKSGSDAAQSGSDDATQQQADDGSGQVQKKKKTQAQSGSDADQTEQQATDKKSTTEDSQQQATDQNATKKKQANDATGSTSKAEITTEKRKVIREKLVTTNVTKVDRSKINFDINVGVAVPTTIVLQPLPATVIEVVPEYRGYDYFVLADGTIIIVDPGSHQIVFVLSA